MKRPARRSVADARAVAVRALAALDGRGTGRLTELLDVAGLDTRDAHLAREIATGVVRRFRLLDHVLLGYATRGLPDDAVARAALRVGAYQLLFLDRVPAHAAVDRAVACAPRPTAGFVNAVLRRVAESLLARPAESERTELALGPTRSARLPVPLPEDPVRRGALLHGLPAFLVARWAEAHGVERALALAAASSERPGLHVRAVRIDRDELRRRLEVEGVECEPAEHPRMLRCTGGTPPMLTAAHREGACVVQDPTSVAAVEALGATTGERILDLCAAPGTKATWLAEAVGSRGVVLAFDPDRSRRSRIQDNAVRLGLPWLGLIDRPEREAPYDRVLADVPCSNTGVLARRIEVRLRLRETTFGELASEQRDILRRALRLVRPGGVVVYSTCSIEPEENDRVVDAVASELPGVIVERRVTTFPEPPLHDGGYFAVVRRGEDS